MGSMQLAGMLEMTDLDTALSWHLQSNHYPPVPNEMIPVASAAIDAGNEADFDRLIELPDGVEFRDGRTAVEAYRIIDSLHLEGFIEQEEYWED